MGKYGVFFRESIPDGYIADSCFQECTRLSISIIAMGFRFQDQILNQSIEY